jgi:hypothetical protein
MDGAGSEVDSDDAFNSRRVRGDANCSQLRRIAGAFCASHHAPEVSWFQEDSSADACGLDTLPIPAPCIPSVEVSADSPCAQSGTPPSADASSLSVVYGCTRIRYGGPVMSPCRVAAAASRARMMTPCSDVKYEAARTPRCACMMRGQRGCWSATTDVLPRARWSGRAAAGSRRCRLARLMMQDFESLLGVPLL